MMIHREPVQHPYGSRRREAGTSATDGRAQRETKICMHGSTSPTQETRARGN
jgi:hypothetical protein